MCLSETAVAAGGADFSTMCTETLTAAGNDRMSGLCPCLADKVKEGADQGEITTVLKSSPQSMRQTMGGLSESTRTAVRGCMREAFAGGGRGGPPGASRPSGGDSSPGSASGGSSGESSGRAATTTTSGGSNTAKAGAGARRDGGSRGGRGGGFQSRPVPVAVTLVERGRVDAYYATTTTLTSQEEAVVVVA